jgi:outer membrane receptor protein involved in Fe transport
LTLIQRALRWSGTGLLAAGLAAAPSLAAAQDAGARPRSRRLSGVVQDADGASVPMAIVTARAEDGASRRVATDVDGRFSFLWVARFPVQLEVEADGFARLRRSVDVLPDGALTLVLERARAAAPPASFAEELTVTASRHPEGIGQTPASLTVLSTAELDVSPSLTIDDTLRRVPGFTLFRRAGSRGANPTAQGASLRGVGGSGASRAAVLEDGLLLNDPFGGWVYWSRVPRVAVDRVEVLRGGASDLYGSGALAGVVHFVRPTSAFPRFDGELAWDNLESGEGSLFTAGRRAGWGMALAADVFTTEGYFAVPEGERGDVDTPVAAHHHVADLTLERTLGEEGRLFVRGGRFRENRANGTRLQDNDTEIDQGVAGLDAHVFGGGLQVRGRMIRQEYLQSFSAVAADRNSERFTIAQRVPVRATDLSVQWTPRLAGHAFAFGAERRTVRGTSEEENFAGATPVRTVAGGRQRTTAFFAEDAWALGSTLTLTGAVRMDRWRNFDGRQGPAAAPVRLGEREERAISPRFGALLRLSDHVALTAGYSRAFRAPTLNELYRSFRVGNVLTQANEQLEAERLRGREAGVRVTFGGRFVLRATGFSMDVRDTVANVTLATTPALITRQRRNVGALRSRGVEAELEALLGHEVTYAAASMYADSRIRSFTEDPNLVGLREPQVPRHQGTLELRRTADSGLLWALQARYVGRQFDDDQNRLPLGAYVVLDALVSHSINRFMSWYLAVENARDSVYSVGRTPNRTVGPPRSIRGGLRVRLRGAPSPRP